jgi:hypothetical protein
MSTTGLTITDLLFIYTGGATKNSKRWFNFYQRKDSDNLLETILAVKSYVPKHSFVRRGLYFIMKETKPIIIEWD